MSTMQNYLISRPLCGFKNCQSDTPDVHRGQGRALDRIEVKRILREEEEAQVERGLEEFGYDDPEVFLADSPPFYRTETPRG